MRNLRWMAGLLAISAAIAFAKGEAWADETPPRTASATTAPKVPATAPTTAPAAAPATAPPAAAKNDVTQTISVDGKPARHADATLFNCRTGEVLAGPVETDDDGSVTWTQVADGKDCVRLMRLAGSGSAADVVDHTAKGGRVDLTLSAVAPTWSEEFLPFALCAGCVLLVTIPILQFLVGPWTARRDKMVGILSGEPLKLYYRRFRADVNIKACKKPSDDTLSPEDFVAAFKKNFGQWYGRRYYIIPVLLLMAVTGCCAWWGAIEAQGWIDGTRSIDSMSGLAAAALTGGLMWVISDEIDRLRRHDFTTSDVYYYIFRILLSIPFAWAITRLKLTLQEGIPTAIFLGAFPTTSLFTIARRVGSQWLKLGDDPDKGQMELEKLQSVGKTNAERFKDADVSNIGQLTRVDPVDLAIRTNFDFDYISDCVNEALLWVYVGDEIGKLAVYSVRGACEARQLLDDYYGVMRPNSSGASSLADAGRQGRAQKTVKDLAAVFVTDKIPLSEEALLETLHQAGDDPYTNFLLQIWR